MTTTAMNHTTEKSEFTQGINKAVAQQPFDRTPTLAQAVASCFWVAPLPGRTKKNRLTRAGLFMGSRWDQ